MKEKKQDHRHKLAGFDLIAEVWGWLQIVASPLIVGVIVGAIIYLSNPTSARLALAIIVGLAGLIIGILFANKVWKKHGTLYFISRVMATPELEHSEDEKKDEEIEEKK